MACPSHPGRFLRPAIQGPPTGEQGLGGRRCSGGGAAAGAGGEPHRRRSSLAPSSFGPPLPEPKGGGPVRRRPDAEARCERRSYGRCHPTGPGRTVGPRDGRVSGFACDPRPPSKDEADEPTDTGRPIESPACRLVGWLEFLAGRPEKDTSRRLCCFITQAGRPRVVPTAASLPIPACPPRDSVARKEAWAQVTQKGHVRPAGVGGALRWAGRSFLGASSARLCLPGHAALGFGRDVNRGGEACASGEYRWRRGAMAEEISIGTAHVAPTD